MATKSPHTHQQKHLAVLIDADNAQAAIVEDLFEGVAKYGIASVKRMYGDRDSSQLGSWKKLMLDHSIQPIQQFAYTKGKNATDSSMTVYGFGEEKTPKTFVKACDKFIYTEILRAEVVGQGDKVVAVVVSPAVEIGKTSNPSSPAKQSKVPVEFIAKVLDDIVEGGGWAQLGALGNTINKLRSDFDCRRYGHKKLRGLIRGPSQWFELKQRGDTSTGGAALYVRNRGRAAE